MKDIAESPIIIEGMHFKKVIL